MVVKGEMRSKTHNGAVVYGEVGDGTYIITLTAVPYQLLITMEDQRVQNSLIWSEECSISFQELRSRLVAAPTLTFPDFSKPFLFLLETNVCETGIGAVLLQEHDSVERVVAYSSHTLSKAE